MDVERRLRETVANSAMIYRYIVFATAIIALALGVAQIVFLPTGDNRLDFVIEEITPAIPEEEALKVSEIVQASMDASASRNSQLVFCSLMMIWMAILLLVFWRKKTDSQRQ